LVLLLALTFGGLAGAQTPGTFSTHVGVTQWNVDVTEDETACGSSGLKMANYVLSIQHNSEIADVGNWGHGPARGTFYDNRLRMPARSIPDGSGTSDLHAFDLLFTEGCRSFNGSYRWDYRDSYTQCSGTTTLKGRRMDAGGCPTVVSQVVATTLREQIAQARTDPDDRSRESRYKEILAKDPKNFWANWDLAELKKKQGKYGEFFQYFDQATTNEDIYPKTREKLKDEVLKRFNLSKYPAERTSPILRMVRQEADGWNGGIIFNENVPKEAAADKPKWYIKLWRSFSRYAHTIVSDIAGLPEG
jgi:hypothetical protein